MQRVKKRGGWEGGRLVWDSLMLPGKFVCTQFSSAAVSHYIPASAFSPVPGRANQTSDHLSNITFLLV